MVTEPRSILHFAVVFLAVAMSLATACSTAAGAITISLSSPCHPWATRSQCSSLGSCSCAAAQQLFGHVDGTAAALPRLTTEGTGGDACQANHAYLTWFTTDQLVLSTLLSSMTEEVLGQLTQCAPLHEVWDALHTMFSVQNHARVMQVRYQLSNLKKKDLTAAVYSLRL